MSDGQETELETAQRGARAMFIAYTDEDAATLRAKVRAEWLREFGPRFSTIVPPWLGKILNEEEP